MMNSPGLKSRHVEVRSSGSSISVSFKPSVDITLGSLHRAKEARQQVALLIRRTKPQKITTQGGMIVAIFDIAASSEVAQLLVNVDRTLDKFRKGNIHPKLVDQILGITVRERLRWTKDGRLPTSGQGSFSVGKRSVYFDLHPAIAVANLALKPEIITAWRVMDALQAPGTTQRKGN